MPGLPSEMTEPNAVLILEDGSRFPGRKFGAPTSTSGEIGKFFLGVYFENV